MPEPKEKAPLEKLDWLIMSDVQIGQLLDEHWQRDRGLHTRERSANTEVNAMSEGNVLVGLAPELTCLRRIQSEVGQKVDVFVVAMGTANGDSMRATSSSLVVDVGDILGTANDTHRSGRRKPDIFFWPF